MNSVVLLGRLTRDPEVRWTQGENPTAVTRFTVAVDRRRKDQTADFPSCIAFGKTAEFVGKYFKKGSRICLEGRLQTGSYTKSDGMKVFTTDVVAENVEFAQNKSESDQTDSVPDNVPQTDADGFMQIPEGAQEELPFM